MRAPSEIGGRRPSIPIIYPLISTILFLWLGWHIIAGTAADNFAAGDPSLALVWDRGHARAQARLAKDILAAAPDDPAAIAAARERAFDALKASPLSSDALSVVARSAILAGDAIEGARLMQLVVDRNPRDLHAHALLLERALQAGDEAASLRHLDAILRVRANMMDQAVTLVASLLMSKEGLDAVIKRLETLPPWRSAILARLPALVENSAVLFPFYAALGESRAPADAHELNPFVGRLIEQGQVTLARTIASGSSAPGRDPGANVTNGGFESTPSGLPFDWTFGRVRGADAYIDMDAEKGRALRVQFYRTRVPFRHVSQVLSLAPGDYRLAMQVKLNDLENERGLQWTVACLPDEKAVIAETEHVAGDSEWRELDTTFTVPAECGAQTLRLSLAARVPAEQEVSGGAWFDDIAIDRVSRSEIN